MHVHVGVDDLAQSVRFYTTLFGAEPSVMQADYAKWMLDDPRLNFAISNGHATRGIEHLGIQVEDAAELAEVAARLARADGPVLEEAATSCCYATSSKAWIADPQGVVWETFLTTGSAADYGNSPALSRLQGESAADGACCAPALKPALSPVSAPVKSGCC
jgi:catechol 2,3-dioxygenase-like lactoylglutathione lyase family enzyme